MSKGKPNLVEKPENVGPESAQGIGGRRRLRTAGSAEVHPQHSKAGNERRNLGVPAGRVESKTTVRVVPIER